MGTTTVDAPFGLRPHSILGSAPNSMGTRPYVVQSSGTAGSNSAIYQGDIVKALTNGLVDVCGSDGDTGNTAAIGVMAGCEYINNNGEPVFDNNYPGAASVKDNTQAIVHVYDNPFQIFEIQCDASLTNNATGTALIFSNAEGTGFGSQTGTTGISTGEISVASAGATTADDAFRIVGFKDHLDNLLGSDDLTTAGVIALVTLQAHAYLQTTGL
jgi:hypothetical protein